MVSQMPCVLTDPKPVDTDRHPGHRGCCESMSDVVVQNEQRLAALSLAFFKLRITCEDFLLKSRQPTGLMDLHANEFEFQELPGLLLPDLPALASCIAALSSALSLCFLQSPCYFSSFRRLIAITN